MYENGILIAYVVAMANQQRHVYHDGKQLQNYTVTQFLINEY